MLRFSQVLDCETETMAVFGMAGATSERHINRLVSRELSLSDMTSWPSQRLLLGDHLGSGD